MSDRIPRQWVILFVLLASNVPFTHAARVPASPPTPQPLQISAVVQPDGSWTGEARFPASPPLEPGVQARQGAAAVLASQRIDYTFSREESGANVFSLAGTQADQIVEVALAAGHADQRFAGPVALEIAGTAHRRQAVRLVLTANPSTGYAWEVAPTEVLVPSTAEPDFRPLARGLGVPGRQVLRFRVTQEGYARLRLDYRRPWQADRPPAVQVTVQPAGLSLAGACRALSRPLPARPAGATSEPAERAPRRQPSRAVSALPASFNWCSRIDCPPAQDQGDCGSCWAFATVGVMEMALQIHGEPGPPDPTMAHLAASFDLSEQYLLSCNFDDGGDQGYKYDCIGGWFAHQYHVDKIPPGETAAGAVWESEFPYTAQDTTPCAGPYDHPYRAATWEYIIDDWTTPSVEEIKRAVYTQGPIAVAVCSTWFNTYTGGYFDHDAPCLDHAVIIVGWDDAAGPTATGSDGDAHTTDGTGAWIIRNSWGTNWGESWDGTCSQPTDPECSAGYMQIAYGVSNVGYAANYLVYRDKAFLPLVSRPIPHDSVPLNGGFEYGQEAWSASSTTGRALVRAAADLPKAPHAGGWAAWLGGQADEDATLSQTIVVPDEASTLDYWYWIDSTDYCAWDFAYVRFGPPGPVGPTGRRQRGDTDQATSTTTLETYDLCSVTNTGGWVKEHIDVSGWRGQEVDLRFVIDTDGSLVSSFYLDDVEITSGQ